MTDVERAALVMQAWEGYHRAYVAAARALGYRPTADEIGDATRGERDAIARYYDLAFAEVRRGATDQVL